VEENNKEKTAYEDKDKELDDGIKQMTDALKTLSDVGADQTQAASSDHKQFMQGHKGANLIAVKQAVNQALEAASAVMKKEHMKPFVALLQGAPGNYAAQSGEIVGILKGMRDTFQANKNETSRVWNETKTAHDNLIEEMKASYTQLKTSYETKQGSLGTKDNSLTTLRGQLKAAKKTKSDAEEFLTTLKKKCKAKEGDYEKRVDLRVNEEAAISQAVQILNSDDSHHSINRANAKVHEDTFIQEKFVSRHSPLSLVQTLQEVKKASSQHMSNNFLQLESGKAAVDMSFLGKLVARVKESTANTVGQVFDSVLLEIMKMKAKIVRERKVDKAQKAWCVKERKITNDDITTKTSAIGELGRDIATMTTEIEDPVTGLLIQIKTEEETLSKCIKDQEEETQARQDENAEYQSEIANYVKSQELIKKATRVLKQYYDEIKKESDDGTKTPDETTQPPSFVQVGKPQPVAAGSDKDDAPDTWKDEYKGQGKDGNSALATLKTILENMGKGEKNAHSAEVTAQHAFEDSMTQLKKDEKDAETSITALRLSLTEKKKNLNRKTKDEKATTKEKKELQEYLLDIKPECDYIMENIVMRDANRVTEDKALDTAVTKIKDTKAYKEGELDDKIKER